MSPPLRRSLAGLLLVFALCGCDRSASTTGPSARGQRAADPDSGAVPQRIVSLAPSVTETLFALGEGERVVGVTRFCDFPPEARTRQRVGGLTDVDVEMVLSLEPDLVVGVNNETSVGLRRTLEAADVETLFLPVETFADVRRSIETLGRRVDAEERAREVVAEIDAFDGQPGEGAPRVLVLFGRDPWIGAGRGTFAHQMIERAGGQNALAHLETEYPTLDAERLGALDVDLVIDTSWGDEAAKPPTGDAPVMRIDPALMRPGPRLADAMKFFEASIRGASEQ